MTDEWIEMGPPGFEPGSMTPEATSIAMLAHGPKFKRLKFSFQAKNFIRLNIYAFSHVPCYSTIVEKELDIQRKSYIGKRKIL
jgi:hypothetical protein